MRARGVSGPRRNAGFTLIEILVSLAVLSVATSVLVYTIRYSVVISSEVKHRRVAADAATELLTEMQRNPSAFQWPALTDQLQPVTRGGEVGGVERPDVVVTYPSGDIHVTNLYREFRWRGYARLPQPDSRAVELTVVVFWRDNGRDCQYTMTTMASRRIAEGGK